MSWLGWISGARWFTRDSEWPPARGWTDAELYEFAQTQLHELGDEGLIVRPAGISEQRFERILSDVLKGGGSHGE